MSAKQNSKSSKRVGAKALFIVRAKRALRRAARKVRAEHRRLGLRPLVWKQTPLAGRAKA
jgi:hypothetical protein